jgi:hypothetical protein
MECMALASCFSPCMLSFQIKDMERADATAHARHRVSTYRGLTSGYFSVRDFFEKCTMFLGSPVKRSCTGLPKNMAYHTYILRMCGYWLRTWRPKKNTFLTVFSLI